MVKTLEARSSEEEITRNIQGGFGHLNFIYEQIKLEEGEKNKGDQVGAIASLNIIKQIIEEYPDKTASLKAKYYEAKGACVSRFGELGETNKEIIDGTLHLDSCSKDIEEGDMGVASAKLIIVQKIIKKYPGQAEILELKYNHVKTAYEAKFGKLELGVQ